MGARHGVARQRLAEETAWYCRGVRKRLVLWDVDHTLVNAGGLSPHLYVLVFAELFGRKLEEVAPMAGRTDRAIILDTLVQGRRASSGSAGVRIRHCT